MKAFVTTEGRPAFREVPDPVAGDGEVLVRIGARALNRADLLRIEGHWHGQGPAVAGQILGAEWAGEIIALGEGVTGFEIGQRVMGGGAAFADLAKTRADMLLPVPPELSIEEASCYPVALRTMHNALATAGELRAGQSVLIQGAATGVGLMGLQMARLLGASLVIGSSTTAAKRDRLADYGADLAIDSGDPAWVTQVLDATGGQGVDLIIDQVSGPLVTPNMQAARILGRIVNVGRLGGERAEFDADLHALRRLSYVGVTFRTRTLAEMQAIDRAMIADLGADFSVNRLKMPIDTSFAFADIDKAFARMKANQHFGKIVLAR